MISILKFEKSNNWYLLAAALAISVGCIAQSNLPADKNATKETVNLYHNLKKTEGKGILIGHQDATAYGVGWKRKKNRSDIRDITGEYPAVYGWDLSFIELDKSHNIDGVRFGKIRKLVKQAYLRGGVNTFSWHCHSPFEAPKGAWDTTKGTVASILPGGVNFALYKSWLDEVAQFFLSLKGEHDELIPVLFRPFHELTGSWFWWGQNECTPDELKNIWRFTEIYLRDVKQVHNLLYVYNTGSEFNNSTQFLERYPGDDFADVLSFDTYQFNDPVTDSSFLKATDAKLAILDAVGKERNKLTALAETGYEAIPYAEWWTRTLYPAIAEHNISYVLLWRNAGYNKKLKRMHYYAPYIGQVSVDDFEKFYKKDKTLFEKKAADEKLYQ
jgi:hypothetical protein